MRTEPSLWSRISWPNQRGTDASLEKAMFAVRLSVSPAAGARDSMVASRKSRSALSCASRCWVIGCGASNNAKPGTVIPNLSARRASWPSGPSRC